MTEKAPKSIQTHAPLTCFPPKVQQAAAVSDWQLTYNRLTTLKYPRVLTCSSRRDNTWRTWCHQHPPSSLCGPSWPRSWAVSPSRLAGTMLRALTLALLGRSKPNSLLEGTENDAFIPYCKQCRSFSCLFAHLVPCHAPQKGGSGTGGLCQGAHIGIPVEDVMLNMGTLFHGSLKCRGWGTHQ